MPCSTTARPPSTRDFLATSHLLATKFVELQLTIKHIKLPFTIVDADATSLRPSTAAMPFNAGRAAAAEGVVVVVVRGVD